MKERTLKTKLLTVLLTLCLALSIVPISAFAESGAYAVKFYPGDYGTMKNNQIPFVYYGIDDDVNKPYYYKLNVSETETLSFAGSIIDTLLPNSGYEFAYWTADAAVYQVGSNAAISAGTALSSEQLQNTITVKSDVTFTAHFKQISEYPEVSEISTVEIIGATLSYNPGDTPQATAAVAAADQGKYRIADEYWQELNENDVAVAVWHSDDGAYSTLPTITAFESEKKYVYSVLLMPEREYDFGREVAATVNGNAVTAVPATDGYLSLPNVKTIIPTESYNPTVIDLIEINDVTVSFKDGDKPKFTGSVPDNAGYAFRCEWWSLDGDTGIVSTEPEWGGDIYKNKITAFKAGKTYHYGVYVTAYTADISPDAKLKINGREVNYTRIGDDGDTQSFWVETNLTMTPTAAGETPNYKIIEGANGTWTQNRDGTLTFRANGDFSKFTGVKIDGTLIDPKNYTAKSGSTIITLKADYLKTLSVGTHKLTVVYTDGECSTNFEVKQAASEQTKPTERDKSDTTTPTGGKDTTSPQTGDNSNMLLWVALLFVSGFAIIGTTIYSKKKRVR
ncbi:MAG: X2-like carbohydrate binding domain-containing protein [Clostridiales bacterium]|nr:X2-like carbohydrate binding domain-containing protein [Clostridiales bacterium]